MPTLVNPDLDWAIEDVRSRLPKYALYREYDEGNHRLVFATEKYRNAFGDLFREFADNLCDDVVDSITDRLQIQGWTSTDKGLNEALETWWTHNRGEARAGLVHRNGFREGDGFAIVQQDRAGRSHLYVQNPALMAVRYSTDNPDDVELAAKVWRIGKRYRANLYYPGGRIERYASKGTGTDGALPRAGAFALLKPGDPALAQDQEAVTEDPDGRMPVYHYPNGAVSDYGRSILHNVIPLQDALNKSVADMLVAMEFAAYPQRWATGVQVERDPVTGKEISPFQAGEGRVWRVGSKDATLGQFAAAEMGGFLDVQDGFKAEIARKGSMPPHSIQTRGHTSALPSGVALLVAEGKTIKLARDRQRDWGIIHREAVAHGMSLELGTLITADDIDLDWANPATRDEQALLESLALKKELGVPVRQLLLEAGYSQDEVDDFMDEAEQESADAQATLSVLAGGRQGVTAGQARTVNGALGLPPGPVPPNGSGSSLAGR